MPRPMADAPFTNPVKSFVFSPALGSLGTTGFIAGVGSFVGKE